MIPSLSLLSASLARPRRLHLGSTTTFVSTTTTTTRRNKSEYVVVGAGSAGCVVAARLAQAGRSVTLLEAGHSDRSFHVRDFFLHMPTALAWPMSSPRYNWGFVPEPEPSLGGRVVSCPRGKGLGGSSSINGMVYVRGHPEDFNHWGELVGEEWDYRHVLPYFVKAENWAGGVDPPYRGTHGPLHVKFGENAAKTPLFDAFIQAGGEAGYRITDDYNAQRQEGFGQMAMTVFHSGPMKGFRCSTASAYLHPAQSVHPGKLNVITQAMTQRILFEESASSSDPPRAIGVEYIDKSGTTKTEMAIKEVILCAGAIQSPQLLQISGIGAGDHLDSIGVKPKVVNNNVGKNLQDHLELYFQQEVKPPISIAPVLKSWIEKLKVGVRWILMRDGLGATDHFESAAFVRSSPDKAYPDVQFHFLPVAVSYDGESLAPSKTGHSMQVHVGTCRSKSRGHVLARSSNANETPEIRFNYMSHNEDWEDMRKAIRVARQVYRQPAMAEIAGDEIFPGEGVDLNDYIREHVESAYHPCGTCAMGQDPSTGAVVDKRGQVFGVSGLRVVDASVFPSITNGNLNAPVIMLAERMSDLILGKSLPPAEFTETNQPWTPPPEPFMDREAEPMAP